MLFGVCVSCRILYSIVSVLYVSCSGSITSVEEVRPNFSASFTCNYVVSVRRGFLFLWAALFYCGTHWAFHIIILLFTKL